MFRLCIDLTTKDLISREDGDNSINQDVRKNLSKRLKWLLDNNKIPKKLESLSETIRLDGNDGAHDGTLQQDDAYDLMEFTSILLEGIYTLPENIKIAEQRRV